MPEVTHGSLELPGFWRLAWFGKLDRTPSFQSSPRIKAYLRPLPEWPQARSTIDKDIPPTLREINVGDITLLHLNAVLGDGRIQAVNPNPWGERAKFTLDLARANLTVFRRLDVDEAGNSIVPVRSNHLLGDPEANALFVGIGEGSDPYAYVVPCVENFRFFYSTSSTLTKATLSGVFLDPNRHMWDVAESWINRVERTAFIQLRKRMLDADARFLARFAFDDYALMQAREIFLYAAGRVDGGSERTIRALPPFQGETKFTANVVKFESAGRYRRLITQFISCDWRPPFDEVEFLRDNDGRFDPRNRGDRDSSDWKQRPPPQSGKPPDKPTLGDGPAHPDLAPWDLGEPHIDERFPGLGKTKVTKRERKEATTKGSGPPKKGTGTGTTDQGTTGDRKSSADEVKEVLISGLGLLIPEKEEIATDVNAHIGDMAYLLTMRLLKKIGECAMANVEFVRAATQVTYIDGVVFNVFPDDLGLERRAWLYVDSARTFRRFALVATLQHKGQVRHLIDIQHKRENECSMLVLWSPDERELEAGFLGQALLACQKDQGANLKSLDHLPIHWGRLKHTAQDDGEEDAKRLLGRIFSAKPV
jgi:hypothetical protein